MSKCGSPNSISRNSRHFATSQLVSPRATSGETWVAVSQATSICITLISKIELVIYYQCCVLIG